MEEKYYTPTIEEFYRGFIYEYKSTTTFGTLTNTKGEWKRADFYGASSAEDEHSEMDDIEFAIDKEKVGIEVRVKYLDNEDIESLGWEITGLTDQLSLKFMLKGKDGLDYALFLLKDSSIYITKPYNEDRMVAFVGVVKNKSRLKLIMEMIGII